VPRHAGSASLLWKKGPWQGALVVRAEGPDADIDPSTFAPATRPGFVIGDIAASYRLKSGIEITARIENLAGTHYQQALGYGEPRRMVFVGLRRPL
jgi:outer membrane cobalamin receptor